MTARGMWVTAAVGAAVLAVSAGSALAAGPGTTGQPAIITTPTTRIYHCDLLTGGAITGSATVQLVNGIPDPTTVHGTPACLPAVQAILSPGL